MFTHKIIYLGFNGFLTHKRGVENVIDFQSSLLENYSYYLHWGEEFKVYKYNHLICISIPHNKWNKYILISFIVKKIIKKNNNKVIIHSHNALMSLFLLRKTHLFTVHDGLYYQNKSKSLNIFKVKCFLLLEKILYRRCHWVHFISNFTKSQSLYPSYKNNYTIINNSSNYECKISSVNYTSNNFDEFFPFLKREKFCLIVRSIEERARIDLVIEIAKLQPNIKFVIAGKGPLLNSMRDIVQSKQLNNIFLLGFVPDNVLFMLYYNAQFIMVPAEYGEGFGMPIIEGYLFNKPVIASNKCAIPEVIIDKKFLFNNNSESIIKAINFCINNSLCYNYEDYYNRKYSKSIIQNKYKQLYNNVIQFIS